MEFNFNGKKALVTGGGSGLGRECALLFAKGGADVLIADLKPERCEAVANEVRALGRNAIAYSVDVTNYEQVAQMYKKIVQIKIVSDGNHFNCKIIIICQSFAVLFTG